MVWHSLKVQSWNVFATVTLVRGRTCKSWLVPEVSAVTSKSALSSREWVRYKTVPSCSLVGHVREPFGLPAWGDTARSPSLDDMVMLLDFLICNTRNIIDLYCLYIIQPLAFYYSDRKQYTPLLWQETEQRVIKNSISIVFG